MARNTSHIARSTAAAIDGLLLAGIGLCVLALTARTAGVPIATLLHFAAPALLMLFALIAGLYFLLLGGILGATAGTRLMHVDRSAAAPPDGARAVGRRACGIAARELSILVDVMLALLAPAAPDGRPGAPRSETRWEDRAPAR